MAEIEPATDEDVSYWENHGRPLERRLIARIRQEQARAVKAEAEARRYAALVGTLRCVFKLPPEDVSSEHVERYSREIAEAAEAEAARLREGKDAALAFAWHAPQCEVRTPEDEADYDCTCGYRLMLARVGEQS